MQVDGTFALLACGTPELFLGHSVAEHEASSHGRRHVQPRVRLSYAG
jgi:hypothetical protein